MKSYTLLILALSILNISFLLAGNSTNENNYRLCPFPIHEYNYSIGEDNFTFVDDIHFYAIPIWEKCPT